MKKFGLLGCPLGHSLSPQLHILLNKSCGQNAPKISYQLCEMTEEQLKQEPETIFSLDGFNVTIPYKVSIISQMDSLDSTAKLHGAVNVAALTPEGKWIGYNTDCIGFVRSIQANGVSLKGKVCVLGAGGVGRMFATECARHGCEVAIAVRGKSLYKGEALAGEIRRKLPDSVISACDIAKLSGEFDLLINATPCGMYPHMDESPVDPQIFTQVKTVFDCIYNPSETLLMKQAKQAGCKVIGGLGMLCWQAAAAQEIWMGIKFSDEQVTKVMEELSQLAK